LLAVGKLEMIDHVDEQYRDARSFPGHLPILLET
jgi:hypothetical protein